jgi:hypothetical protein
MNYRQKTWQHLRYEQDVAQDFFRAQLHEALRWLGSQHLLACPIKQPKTRRLENA